MSSEIKRLRELIDLETQAMNRALYGPAQMASHESIQARYDKLGRMQDELATHIGTEAAIEVVVHSYMENVK